jgi:hypothetical protein
LWFPLRESDLDFEEAGDEKAIVFSMRAIRDFFFISASYRAALSALISRLAK